MGAGSPATAGRWPPSGVLVDPLSRAMLVLVTLVSLLVQIYSLGVPRTTSPPRRSAATTRTSRSSPSRCWASCCRPTFLQMFVFWELVGLCSYLLIGYWYDRPAAARAAVKAFWITKLGDLGFIIGIVMLWAATGTFEFPALFGWRRRARDARSRGSASSCS